MADIRIKDLALATGPTSPAPSDVVALDGTTTRKAPLSSLGNIIAPLANQAEAEAGVNSVKRMTPLTTAQAISAQAATASQGTKADNALPKTGGIFTNSIIASDASFFGWNSSGNLRWGAIIDGSSNLNFNRHNSSGVYIDTPLTARYSDGQLITPRGNLRESSWFQRDVRDFSVSTAGTASDNLTAFNNAAPPSGWETVVSRGTYVSNEPITLGSGNWLLEKGAKITDSGGGYNDSSYYGAAAGEFLTPHPIDNVGRIRSDHGMLHVLKETMSTAQPGGLSYNHSNQVYRYVDSSIGSAGGDTSYYVTGAGYWVYSPVGTIAKAEGRRQSGSTDLFGGLLFMSTATGDAAKPGRSEMTPISIGCYCAHDWVGAANGQQKINIYMDWNMSGPSNEEERFMAGHSQFMRKFHPGDTYDADHNGSFGVSIATSPGNDGFGVPSTSGLQTYPLRAGVAISGFSGLISAGATSGAASASTLGFKYGVLVGGSNNVYLDGSASAISKIGVAYAGRDYTVAGIQLFSAHPSSTDPYAVDASSSAGRFKFGIDGTLLAGAKVGIGASADQFQASLYLEPSRHPTSNRAGISFANGFGIVSDMFGNGTDDFGIYHGATTRYPISVTAVDKVHLWSLIIDQQYTPTATGDAAGVFGEILTDDNYIYVKRSGGWKRVAISNF